MTDREVHTAFKSLTILGDKAITVQIVPLLGTNEHGSWTEKPVNADNPFGEMKGKETEWVAWYTNQPTVFVYHFTYKYKENIDITYYRPFDAGKGRLLGNQDELRISFGNSGHKEATEVLSQVRKLFPCADVTSLPDILGEDAERYYTHREETLQRLEGKIGEFVSKLADFAVQNETQLRAKRDDLDKAHADRLAEVEASRATQQAEMDEQRKQLDERAAKINDRENVHERRRLYDEIKKQIQSKSTNPSLTKHTKDLRYNVWVLSGIAAAFLLIVFVTCFVVNLRSDTVNWVSVGSQIGSGVTLVGLATFVIRWQNRWFQTHADEEYRLKRLELDIERASWLVELALEWFNETQNPIPQELLEKLATSLFTEGASGRHIDLSPLESLRSGMLGKNWRFSIDPNGKVEAHSGRPSKDK